MNIVLQKLFSVLAATLMTVTCANTVNTAGSIKNDCSKEQVASQESITCDNGVCVSGDCVKCDEGTCADCENCEPNCKDAFGECASVKKEQNNQAADNSSAAAEKTSSKVDFVVTAENNSAANTKGQTSSNKNNTATSVSSCPQTAGNQSNYNPGRYVVYSGNGCAKDVNSILNSLFNRNCTDSQNCIGNRYCIGNQNCPDNSQNCQNNQNCTENQNCPGSENSTSSAGSQNSSQNNNSENNTTNDTAVLEAEKQVVVLVNQIRKSYGLSELKLNAKLCGVARVKSEDMLAKKYFAHNSPTYGTPFEMMKSFGISYKTAGENIAMGYPTAQAVVDGWMNSEGHRANILNSSFKEIGVGYCANGNYWTQMFIG